MEARRYSTSRRIHSLGSGANAKILQELRGRVAQEKCDGGKIKILQVSLLYLNLH